MGILMAIIVYLVIFATPFLIGWNIIRKKRPRDVGDLVAAIVLLLFYFPISSFLMVMINEDLPPYAVTNEGFMFHAEKTYGIENFYNLAQKNLQAYQKKSGYVNIYEVEVISEKINKICRNFEQDTTISKLDKSKAMDITAIKIRAISIDLHNKYEKFKESQHLLNLALGVAKS